MNGRPIAALLNYKIITRRRRRSLFSRQLALVWAALAFALALAQARVQVLTREQQGNFNQNLVPPASNCEPAVSLAPPARLTTSPGTRVKSDGRAVKRIGCLIIIAVGNARPA